MEAKFLLLLLLSYFLNLNIVVVASSDAVPKDWLLRAMDFLIQENHARGEDVALTLATFMNITQMGNYPDLYVRKGFKNVEMELNSILNAISFRDEYQKEEIDLLRKYLSQLKNQLSVVETIKKHKRIHESIGAALEESRYGVNDTNPLVGIVEVEMQYLPKIKESLPEIESLLQDIARKASLEAQKKRFLLHSEAFEPHWLQAFERLINFTEFSEFMERLKTFADAVSYVWHLQDLYTEKKMKEPPGAVLEVVKNLTDRLFVNFTEVCGHEGVDMHFPHSPPGALNYLKGASILYLTKYDYEHKDRLLNGTKTLLNWFNDTHITCKEEIEEIGKDLNDSIPSFLKDPEERISRMFAKPNQFIDDLNKTVARIQGPRADEALFAAAIKNVTTIVDRLKQNISETAYQLTLGLQKKIDNLVHLGTILMERFDQDLEEEMSRAEEDVLSQIEDVRFEVYQRTQTRKNEISATLNETSAAIESMFKQGNEQLFDLIRNIDKMFQKVNSSGEVNNEELLLRLNERYAKVLDRIAKKRFMVYSNFEDKVLATNYTAL